MSRFVFVASFAFVVLIGLAARSYGAAPPLRNATPDSEVTGFWYTQDHDGGIELYSCGDEICGRFYWLKEDEGMKTISLDSRNPDPEKRSRPLCHEQFMGGFKPTGKGHYAEGWIYSPLHGATFQAEMTLVNHDTLDLHGYIFVPALGQSQTWTRVKNLPSCARS